MPKKFKKLFVLFTFVFLFLTISHTALALEVSYPTIPGFPNLNTAANQNLPNYIDYFFGFAMITAGVLGVFSIVIAGLRMLTSFGNPGSLGEAKERMFGSVLGIVLLMFSFVLLQTINPALITEKTVALTSTLRPGIYRITPAVAYNNPFNIATANADASQALNSQWTVTPASEYDANTLADIPAGSRFLYVCNSPGPDDYFWDYSVTNTNDTDPNAELIAIPCQTLNSDLSNLNNVSISLTGVASYKSALKTAGVYLYLEDNCQGIASDVITASGQLPTAFRDIRSARIINGDSTTDPNYGFVLNADPGREGECSNPINNFTTADLNDPHNDGICVPTLQASNTCIVSEPTHSECSDEKCIQVPGEALDQCLSDNECNNNNTYTGATCNSQNQCVAGGTGTPCDLTKGNTDCGGSNTYTGATCNSQNQCVVGGTGTPCDLTKGNADCSNSNTYTTTTCNAQKQCVFGGTGTPCDLANINADCGGNNTYAPTGCNSLKQCVIGGTGATCDITKGDSDCGGNNNTYSPITTCNSQNQCVFGGIGAPCSIANGNADCTSNPYNLGLFGCNSVKQCVPGGTIGSCDASKGNTDCGGSNTYTATTCNSAKKCVIGGTGKPCDITKGDTNCGGTNNNYNPLTYGCNTAKQCILGGTGTTCNPSKGNTDCGSSNTHTNTPGWGCQNNTCIQGGTGGGCNVLNINQCQGASNTNPCGPGNPYNPTNPYNANNSGNPYGPNNPYGQAGPNNPYIPYSSTNLCGPTNPYIPPINPVNICGANNPYSPTNPYSATNPCGPGIAYSPNNPYGPGNPFNPYGPNNPYGPGNPYGPFGPNNPYNPYICGPGSQYNLTNPYTPYASNQLPDICGPNNNQNTTLTITNNCIPANDPGKFGFQVNGTAATDNVACGATKTFNTIAGVNNIAEFATVGTNTNILDYSTSYNCDNTQTASVNLSAGQNKTCIVTNTAGPVLTVIKIVNPNAAGDHGPKSIPTDFSPFWVTNTDTGDSTVVSAGIPQELPVGNYLLFETTDPNYTQVISDNCANGITLGSGDDKSCTITNTYSPCLAPNVRDNTGACVAPQNNATTITISNLCYPNTDPGKFDFQVNGVAPLVARNVSCTTGDVVVSANPGVVNTIQELATANTNTNLNSYTTTYNCDNNGTNSVNVPAGQNKTCIVTNTKKTTVTVSKTCVPGNDSGQFTFNLYDSASNLSEAGTINGCNSTTVLTTTPGQKRIVESSGNVNTDINNYNTTYSCNPNGAQTFTIAQGQNINCTINNERKDLPKLTIVQQFYDSFGTYNAQVPANFPPLLVSNQVITSGIPITLVPGQYNITLNPAGYTETFMGGACALDGTVSLLLGDDKQCLVQYRANPPTNQTLTIENHCTGLNINNTDTFRITVTGPNYSQNWPMTCNIPALGPIALASTGSYTVSETLPSNTNINAYSIPQYSVNCSMAGVVAVTAGANFTCKVTTNSLGTAPGDNHGVFQSSAIIHPLDNPFHLSLFNNQQNTIENINAMPKLNIQLAVAGPGCDPVTGKCVASGRIYGYTPCTVIGSICGSVPKTPTTAPITPTPTAKNPTPVASTPSTNPLVDTTSSCSPLKSQSIFIINGEDPSDPNSQFVGDGVSFYKNYKYINLSTQDIGQQYYYNGSLDSLIASQGTSQSSPAGTSVSEDPRGNFLTIIYTKNEASGQNKECGFFFDQIDSLSVDSASQEIQRIYRNGNTDYQTYVFPIIK